MKLGIYLILTAIVLLSANCLFAQIPGETRIINEIKTETVAQIMSRPKPVTRPLLMPEKELPDRSNLPQNPLSPRVSSMGINKVAGNLKTQSPSIAQTPSTSFDGITGVAETRAFPPDAMGAIGPSQYILFINGRLRSFNKTTGAADGALNADPDVFFSSVMTTGTGGFINFTSDPRIRYDRFSGKWILIIIDVPSSSSSSLGDMDNKLLIAYSNSSTITSSTTFTFRSFVAGAGRFLDYPTLGVDRNALYVGGNMFSPSAGTFINTDAFVINKAGLLSGGAFTVTTFQNLISGGDGPDTPQGVDNPDPSSTEGYFIGQSDAAFGRLIMRRISTPGGVPTISANIPITVSSTSFPITVDHLGDSKGTGTAGNLDALDDRLFGATTLNGHLYTSHNIAVTTAGVASNSNAQRRDAVRWYDLTNLTTTPTVAESGTIFDNAATVALAKQYFIPTMMVSGQGHTAFGFSSAGTPYYANTGTTGKLSTDAAGTSLAPTPTSTSTTAYNPLSDPGSPRRWGDYSYVSLDPLDNMTMWMVAEYCNKANDYSCRITKLLAPLPATPSSSSPSSTANGQASVIVVVTGTVVNGSGFYDPGANLATPALPFNHISATVSGGITVNSVTYTDPTHITLDLNTTAATPGTHNITVTNPDGQSSSGTGLLTTTALSNSITVNTSPDGRSFSVDGTNYTTAQTFSWTSGSSHTIATTTPQAGAPGTQYNFTNWSDGGAISHTVAPTTSTTYTANFSTENSITVNTSPAGRSFSVDGTNYNSAQTFSWVSGSSHTIATTTPQAGAPGTQYNFTNWSDGGAISHTVAPITTTTYTANFATVIITTQKLYLNDNSTSGDRFTTGLGNDATGDGTSAHPYRTINKAISVANPGDSIIVDAGTYPEYINVPKSLTFLGANYDNPINFKNPASACTGGSAAGCRLPESVITAQVSSLSGEAGAVAFEARMVGIGLKVVIKGFKIQSGRPLTDGHYQRNSTNDNDVTILFEKNFVTNGDNLFCGTLTPWKNVTIKDNYFSLITQNSTSSAIQLNDANDGYALVGSPPYSNNHAANIIAVIDSNSVNNTNAGGILLDNIGTAYVRYNNIMNVAGKAGIQLAGGMGNADVLYNTVSKVNTAAATTPNDGGAIRIYDGNFTGTINIKNNLLSASGNCFAIKNGTTISNPNLHVNRNSFAISSSVSAGPGNYAIYDGATHTDMTGSGSTPEANKFDAECNWFGSANAAVGIVPKIYDVSKVDYTPYLTSGSPNTTAYGQGFNTTEACGAVAMPITMMSNISMINIPFISAKSITPTSFKVVVSPNPSTNNFTVMIASPANDIVKIRIVDVAGRRLQMLSSAPNTNFTFGSNLNKGVYFLHVRQGTNNKIIKVIKL